MGITSQSILETRLASPRFLLITAVCLALLGGLIPLLFNFIVFYGAPALEPAQAASLLEKQGASVQLVDLRSSQDFATGHVAGSLNVPMDKILTTSNPEFELPSDLQNKTLVFICDSGINSAFAARYMAFLGQHAYYVTGGLQEWQRAAQVDWSVLLPSGPTAAVTLPPIVNAAGQASPPSQKPSRMRI